MRHVPRHTHTHTQLCADTSQSMSLSLFSHSHTHTHLWSCIKLAEPGVSSHAKWTTAALNEVYIFNHFTQNVKQTFFCLLNASHTFHPLSANKGITAYVELCVFVVKCFLSISWKVRTLYFSKYIYEKDSMYLNTVYDYVIVYCVVGGSECSGFVVFWACLHSLPQTCTFADLVKMNNDHQ